MRRLMEVAVGDVLPLDTYLRAAVEYANLKSCGAGLPWVVDGMNAELRSKRSALPLFTQLETKEGKPQKKGRLRRTETTTPCTERCCREHKYVQGLISAAVEGRPLGKSVRRELVTTLDDVTVPLELGFDGKGFTASIEMKRSDANLWWFIYLGCASLFEELKGPFVGAVGRCANFGGDNPERSYCGNYFLKVSEGGAPREKFCSTDCQNKVNQREQARKRREKERLAVAADRKFKATFATHK